MSNRDLHSIAAEQSVLGAIMLTDGRCLHEVTDIIEARHFFRKDHEAIFEVLIELDRRKSPLDPSSSCCKSCSP